MSGLQRHRCHAGLGGQYSADARDLLLLTPRDTVHSNRQLPRSRVKTTIVKRGFACLKHCHIVLSIR